MPSLQPMTPGATIAITVAATTAAVAIPTPLGNQVIISSLAANAIAFVNFGISTVAVVIPTGTKQNATPILPGTVQTFTIPADATHIATIGTAANTLYVTSGNGE